MVTIRFFGKLLDVSLPIRYIDLRYNLLNYDKVFVISTLSFSYRRYFLDCFHCTGIAGIYESSISTRYFVRLCNRLL